MATAAYGPAKTITTVGAGFHHPATGSSAVCEIVADTENDHLLHWIVADATNASGAVAVLTLTVAIGGSTILKTYIQRADDGVEVEQKPCELVFDPPISTGLNSNFTITLTSAANITSTLTVGYT